MTFLRLIYTSYLTSWAPRIKYKAKNCDSKGIFLFVTANLSKNRPFYALFELKNLTLIDSHTVQGHLTTEFTIITTNYIPRCVQHYFKTKYMSVEWEIKMSLN